MPLEIFKHTKFKIITGYVLLALLSITAGLIIYKQISRLAENNTSTENVNQKLFIIGNITTGLYEAEALSNAFVQTNSRRYFQKYKASIEQVEDNIDSLQTLTSHQYQQQRLDSIHFLLNEKVQNLQNLVKVKQLLVPDEFYSKAIASIESGRDTSTTANIHQRTVTIADSSYVPTGKKKRKWFLGKAEPDSVLKVTISHHTVIDSVESTTQNTDTVVNILKSVWQDLQEQTQHVNRQINQQEYALINQSTHITDQLKRILGEYEKEEIYNTWQKFQQREQVLKTISRVIAWIAVLAFLTILFFTFFILRDLSKSQRYRRQLETANQYAAELLKSREKLILTVTHDIKSPLGSILGYIELLAHTAIDNRQQHFLKNMQSSAQHILNLATNLLDYSKLENNKMQVEEVAFNPFQLFQEVCDSFIPLAAEKHLLLKIHISPTLNRNCKGDALRIRQILANILSNAIKYTPEGEVSFSANPVPKGNGVSIHIQDTGPGMTSAEQKAIFEEFTRLKSNTNIEGTGLGLTITLKLIELLKGNLTIESEPGKGSCFILQLPLHNAAITETKAISPVPRQALTSAVSLQVFLVDDDPLQLEMTSALLQNQGIQVSCTTHPEKALGMLQKSNYDVVFSDIQMPEMDGFTLIRQIRTNPDAKVRNLPVIALSANAEKTSEDYRQAGFTAYLNKPFTPAQLFDTLAQVTGITLNSQALSSTGPTAENQTYTLKNILLFADNDPIAAHQILTSFCQETEKHLSLLENDLKIQDWDAIGQLAHKMLPMFRQLEAVSVIPALQQLEASRSHPMTPAEIAKEVGIVIEKGKELLKKIAQSSPSKSKE